MSTLHCAAPPYCPGCVDLHANRGTGTAHARGRRWARSILANRKPTDPPLDWTTPRALAIAARYLADAVDDPGVMALLVPIMIAAAQAELASPTIGAHELARYRR